jgi:MoaA/NifB/PqqE/SkfB family radical SAM enzyme
MRELSLHITDVCNFRCAFCVWGDTLTRGAERIPRPELTRFLAAHRGRGFERVNLHGGEPTLRKDLFELLAAVRRLGYPDVSIQTNGWALANPGFTRRLVEAGVSLFVISVHGATPDVHDTLAGAAGSLERLLAGIGHVRAAGARVRTNTVVMRPNVHTLPEIAALLAHAGVSHLNISSLMPSGRALGGETALMPTYREVAPYLDEALRVAERSGVEATLEGFPLCTVPGWEDHCLLRGEASGDQITCLIHGEVWANHDSHVEESCKSKRDPCRDCRFEERCAGVYTLYAKARGWGEFQPAALEAP